MKDSEKRISFVEVQKQLKLMVKLQWQPKIKTWKQIKQSQFFKLNKQLHHLS